MEVRNQRMAARNCGRHSWLLPFLATFSTAVLLLSARMDSDLTIG